MLIETTTTPNPATLKFLPGRAVMASGTHDFVSADAAETSPLAAALFSLSDVTRVFYGSDFISVTAVQGADWRDIKPQVLGVLLDHFAGGGPLFKTGRAIPAASKTFEDDPADTEIVDQIKDLIETRIRPAVARDGGDIVYRGFDRGIVFLAMHGACSGCPSSTATLKQGIEQLLKHYVPEVVEVRAS